MKKIIRTLVDKESFWNNTYVRNILLMNNEDKKERNLNIGKYTAVGSELLAWTLLLTGHFYEGLLAHGIGFHYGMLVYSGK